MALTRFAIDKAAPKSKPFKLSDGDGLHLLVQPNGSKLWRFRYRFAGRENMLTFGAFPTISLATARTKRDEARRLLADGSDPAVKRKLDKIAAANMAATGASEKTINKNRWLLEDLAKPLSARPIAEIVPAEILTILKRIEKSGRREPARRLRGVMGSVFRLAVVTLRATTDPTFALRGALLKPNVKHRAAITNERQLGALMTSIDEYDGWPTIRAALQLVALTMTRPGDVRGMHRSEISFDKAVWRIPGERMKMRRPHDVPLSKQAIAILQDIWPISTS